ncbi:CD209 antigen-like protein E [Corythoichthys intestinalis]|uniref:CD209 antigen-like protein E n=1 Tax=Corythoichthys intestinalis TaxID=161448 RepID=UPI0025A62A73|nr:CD209 antigen-like protein E [Corythoichthys intestinalis]
MEMQNVNTKRKQLEEDTGAKEAMLENNGEKNIDALADAPHEKDEAAGSSHYACLQKPSEDIYSKVVKTEKDEATGSSHYASLQKPYEDIYSNVAKTEKKKQLDQVTALACKSHLKISIQTLQKKTHTKTAQSTVRPYKVACLILSVLCLVLLLVVIVLIVKIYPKNQASWTQETCDKDQCSALTPQDEHRFRCCYPCPRGWVRLDQSCFFFSTFNLSQHESERNCSRKRGLLAIIKSDKVQAFLTERGTGLKYWIDVRSIGDPWVWSDYSYLENGYWSDWSERESSGDCVVLDSRLPSDKNWKPYNCNVENYFICQIQI